MVITNSSWGTWARGEISLLRTGLNFRLRISRASPSLFGGGGGSSPLASRFLWFGALGDKVCGSEVYRFIVEVFRVSSLGAQGTASSLSGSGSGSMRW